MLPCIILGQHCQIGNPTLIWILFYDVESDPVVVADAVEGFGNQTND